MHSSQQRDRAGKLAKSDPAQALAEARQIAEPWFRAQALAWIARFTSADPVAIASEAASAARECADEYQRSAVRAWEIAALAERGLMTESARRLRETLAKAGRIVPASSRSEALMLLMAAAIRIGESETTLVYDELVAGCSQDKHWRCRRALRDAGKLRSGDSVPRTFFW